MFLVAVYSFTGLFFLIVLVAWFFGHDDTLDLRFSNTYFWIAWWFSKSGDSFIWWLIFHTFIFFYLPGLCLFNGGGMPVLRDIWVLLPFFILWHVWNAQNAAFKFDSIASIIWTLLLFRWFLTFGSLVLLLALTHLSWCVFRILKLERACGIFYLLVGQFNWFSCWNTTWGYRVKCGSLL